MRLRSRLPALLLAVALLPACEAREEAPVVADAEPSPVVDGTAVPIDTVANIRDIVAASQGLDYYTAFTDALESSGLVSELEEPGPITVFAPVNTAFAAVPQEVMSELITNRPAYARLLRHHMVAGRIDPTDLATRQSLTTLAGTTLPVATVNGELTVGGAQLIQGDLVAGQSIVYGIDRVLTP